MMLWWALYWHLRLYQACCDEQLKGVDCVDSSTLSGYACVNQSTYKPQIPLRCFNWLTQPPTPPYIYLFISILQYCNTDRIKGLNWLINQQYSEMAELDWLSNQYGQYNPDGLIVNHTGFGEEATQYSWLLLAFSSAPRRAVQFWLRLPVRHPSLVAVLWFFDRRVHEDELLRLPIGFQTPWDWALDKIGSGQQFLAP